MDEQYLEKISKWKELKIFFLERIKSPIHHPEYIFYLILIVILAGGIGIWSSISGYEQELNHNTILQNISAFAVAIIAAGSIELFFVKNNVIKVSLLLISLALIGLSMLAFIICKDIFSINGYYLAIPTYVFSLFIWWIANAENANLTKNFFKEQSEKVEELNNALEDYGKV